MKKSVAFTVGGVLLIVLLFIGRIAEYLLSEFVFCRHGYAHVCSHCLSKEEHLKLLEPRIIPNHLHQIFFFETDPVLPPKLRNAQSSWQRYHPGYDYTLWNKTTIQDLIRKKYPEFEDLYNSYGHWVRRADMARYIVLHQYGGWYVDIDIECKHGVQNLSSVATSNNKSIVVRWTDPTGCSNDFIGVTPRHPFFMHVLNGMFESNKWYVFPYATTMFSTGPMFLWGRMMNYPYREEEFYWVFDHSPYFDLMHGSSWHSWDGKIVWYFFNHGEQFRSFLLMLITLVAFVATLVFLWRRKKCRDKNTQQRVL